MMFTMIVCNDVLDIFIHFIDNDPRTDIGTPVFMTWKKEVYMYYSTES